MDIQRRIGCVASHVMLIFAVGWSEAGEFGMRGERGFTVNEVATLRMAGNTGEDHNNVIRSVALALPYAYVLGRNGTIYVFRVPETSEIGHHVLHPIRTYNAAGDGNDLCIRDGVLLLTQDGRLRAYSLDDPAVPVFVGQFGPINKTVNSRSIVETKDRAFLVGDGAISVYSFSRPVTPVYIATYPVSADVWSGCTSAGYLYLAGRNLQGESGIAVLDVRDSGDPQQVGFVSTASRAYHLFPLPDKRMIATMDRGAGDEKPFVSLGSGSSEVFSLEDPIAPKGVGNIVNTGGRTCTFVLMGTRPFLVSMDGVFEVDATGANRVGTFRMMGSTLDGFPYHGDTDGQYVAIAMDRAVIVSKLDGPIEPDNSAANPGR